MQLVIDAIPFITTMPLFPHRPIPDIKPPSSLMHAEKFATALPVSCV